MQHGTPNVAVVAVQAVPVNVAKLVDDHVERGLAGMIATTDKGTEQGAIGTRTGPNRGHTCGNFCQGNNKGRRKGSNKIERVTR